MAAWGLPTGGAAPPFCTEPHSLLVGGSCLLFGVCAWHGYSHGDLPSCALALATTYFSFLADFANNSPAVSSPLTKARICALDRGAAWAYSLWLVRLAVRQMGALMLLTLAPLALVLAHSRAAPSRAAWVRRHSVWHVFCVCECVGVMEFVYASDAHGELRAMLRSWRAVLRLGWAPFGVGILVAVHGLRGAAAHASRRIAARQQAPQ